MATVKRTLVKSGPELWAEVSDPEALGAHFEAFGEIRIRSRTDASLVIWEGERAAGRLALEPSGFGTRVEIAAESAVEESEPAPPAGRWARLLRRRAEPPPPGAPVIPEDEVVRVMTATLDALGSARHRPFTR